MQIKKAQKKVWFKGMSGSRLLTNAADFPYAVKGTKDTSSKLGTSQNKVLFKNNYNKLNKLEQYACSFSICMYI
jgi:hypothetical protein